MDNVLFRNEQDCSRVSRGVHRSAHQGYVWEREGLVRHFNVPLVKSVVGVWDWSGLSLAACMANDTKALF